MENYIAREYNWTLSSHIDQISLEGTRLYDISFKFRQIIRELKKKLAIKEIKGV